MTIETYRGYGIDFNIYGYNKYSVHYCGDDCIFSTLEAAREFIDEIRDEYDTDDLDYTW